MELIIHEDLKKLIEPLQANEYNLLEKSILKEGCRDSIIVWNNVIVDGHNRYEICNKHNISFETKKMEFEGIGQVKKWMINNQLARRNLTDSQRRYYIGKRYEEEKKTITNEKGINQHKEVVVQNEPQAKERTSEKIAQENNINESTVRRNAEYSKAIDDIKKDNIKIAEKILTEEIKTSNKEVIEFAKEEPEKQKKIIELIQVGKVTTIKDAQKEIKNIEKKIEFEQKIEDIRTTAVEMPTGKYQCIVLDPPWSYGTKFSATGRRVANPYPEMSQEELKELEILSEDDSVMFLWTTQKFIWDAKELLEHWGFNYRSMIVWDKEQMGMGDLLRMQCEFCLIGIKGKPLLNNPNNIRDIIREPRREHSRKPETFYEIVNTLCVGSKIEYFSRTEREGWKSFGNETDKF